MYQLADINIQHLKKLKVNNQDEIKATTGTMFYPEKAYQIIKEKTEAFTKEDPIAKEADELFYQLLKDNNLIGENRKTIDEQERIRIRARARQREIEIVELELDL